MSAPVHVTKPPVTSLPCGLPSRHGWAFTGGKAMAGPVVVSSSWPPFVGSWLTLQGPGEPYAYRSASRAVRTQGGGQGDATPIPPVVGAPGVVLPTDPVVGPVPSHPADGEPYRPHHGPRPRLVPAKLRDCVLPKRGHDVASSTPSLSSAMLPPDLQSLNWHAGSSCTDVVTPPQPSPPFA